MPQLIADDGVKLAYEEVGQGAPVVFVHEFAGSLRSWEPQLRHFSRRYRCVAFNARGYPPSDTPSEPSAYSQARAADDIASVLNCLDLAHAHVVGLSMGAFAALHFGFRYPSRARSLVLAGCGYGAEPTARENFLAEMDSVIGFIRVNGMSAFAEKYASGPSRVQFEAKDPRGFAEWRSQLAQNSPVGAINTQLGVQKQRPSLYDLTAEMAAVRLPVLVITGDEDWPCLQPSLLLKKWIATSALAVIPNCGHTINLEEPDQFNELVGAFFAQVDAERWPVRDSRPVGGSITGMR
jgi:pimeloyl-ACP methyl ester carboxylesterase